MKDKYKKKYRDHAVRIYRVSFIDFDCEDAWEIVNAKNEIEAITLIKARVSSYAREFWAEEI